MAATIQPVTIWTSTGQKQVTELLVTSKNDNLKDTAVFTWQLGIDANFPLVVGDITMTGQDYINWNAQPDINTAAYNWVAQQIGVTIITIN